MFQKGAKINARPSYQVPFHSEEGPEKGLDEECTILHIHLFMGKNKRSLPT